MTTNIIEKIYQIQFCTIENPEIWRELGEPQKSFNHSSQQVIEYMNNPNHKNIIKSFRIIEKTYSVSSEEIKTFSLN